MDYERKRINERVQRVTVSIKTLETIQIRSRNKNKRVRTDVKRFRNQIKTNYKRVRTDVKRFRNRFRNVSETVSETFQKNQCETVSLQPK